MVEKSVTSVRNVVDLAHYRKRDIQDDTQYQAAAMSPRLCRHCGAALLEGESEDECSSAFNFDARASFMPARRFVAE